MTASAPLARNPSESQLQQAVIDLAMLRGWLVHHQRPGFNKSGKISSAIQGHAGFPDLVLAHTARRRVLFIELKARKGRLSAEQVRWGEALATAVDYAVWTPAQWFDGTIDKVLIG